MAFSTRTGTFNMPDIGHTVSVYDAGTQSLTQNLTDRDGNPITNPFTVPDTASWGFDTPDFRRIDLYYDKNDGQGNRLILDNFIVKSVYNYDELSGKPILGTAASRDVGIGPNQVIQLDENGQLPVSEIDLETADKYKVAGQPLLNAERVGSLAPVQSVNGLTGTVITNTTEYPNIPRRVYFVYGDSSDGGTTPDATTQASINALIAAGIPTNNIRWLYEVDDGSGGTLIVQSVSGGGTIDNVTLSLAGGVLSVNGMSGGGTIDNIVLTNASGGTFSVASLAGGGTIDNITLVLAGGLLSVNDMSGGGTIDNIVITQQGAGGGTLTVQDMAGGGTIDNITLVEGGVTGFMGELFGVQQEFTITSNGVNVVQNGSTLEIKGWSGLLISPPVNFATVSFTPAGDYFIEFNVSYPSFETNATQSLGFALRMQTHGVGSAAQTFSFGSAYDAEEEMAWVSVAALYAGQLSGAAEFTNKDVRGLLRIEVEINGNARAYVDGVLRATRTGPHPLAQEITFYDSGGADWFPPNTPVVISNLRAGNL